jgi:hypothetical protein
MSQQHVELAREGNAAVRRGDWEAVAANLDPHVFREGRVILEEFFLEHEQALRAVGLAG